MWSFLDPFFTSGEIRRDARKVISSVGPSYHRTAAEALISEFERPVLFAWAEQDRVFPLRHAETYAVALANARVEVIRDSYTYVAEDSPGQLAAALVPAAVA
jgi:pimeloyl-ACP methyl ester carboxylesterase